MVLDRTYNREDSHATRVRVGAQGPRQQIETRKTSVVFEEVEAKVERAGILGGQEKERDRAASCACGYKMEARFEKRKNENRPVSIATHA